MHLNRSESFQPRDIKDVTLVRWVHSNSDFHLQWRVDSSVLLMLCVFLRPLSSVLVPLPAFVSPLPVYSFHPDY